MKSIIVAPDSFKGTLGSLEVCSIVKDVLEEYVDNKIITLPIADGGEGTIEAFLHQSGGRKVFLKTKDPYFNEVESFYGILKDNTAIIEMATTAGLPLVKEKNPSLTTTFGVGEQILDAIQKGCKHIIVALGGSATNDGGAGAACALGGKFFDKKGASFIPTGGTLDKIEQINLTKLQEKIKNISISTMCDINNPFYGKKGAAYVFAAQKGADESMIKRLDSNLFHLNEKVKELFDINLQLLKGSGAAGGMGGGMVAFFGSTLKSGIDIILENASFDKLLLKSSLVITGEGKIDSQSIDGKAICGIASWCKKANVPLVCIVGGYEGDLERFYKLGISAIFSTNKMPLDFEISKVYAKENLRDCTENIIRALKLDL